jgi:hypothetical protein
MNELILIKYLLDKNLYEKYHRYLSLDYLKHNYPEVFKIYLVLAKAHQGALALESVDDLKALFFAAYPALKKNEVDAYGLLFSRIKDTDLSDQVLDAVLESHRKRSAAFEIAGVGFDISEGKKDFSELGKAWEALRGDFKPVEEEIDFVTTSLEELHQKAYAKGGYKWRLRTLQKMMGSLRQGDFGFIFTRPEVGKTTLLASEGVNFAPQLDGPYIHFSNEEFGPKVMIRYYQAAFGITVKELFRDRKRYEKEFLEQTAGRIKIYDAAAITKSKVEEICERLNPRFIVFDSIDKLKGFQDDRDDLVYKQIYAWSRELAKTYGPVIGVCHASVNAERKRWLEMDDVAYAKTAKQGEADWILGIGATYQPGQEFIRHLHLPKNKLMGDEDMDESLRHGKLDVLIHPEIAQYEDLHKFD